MPSYTIVKSLVNFFTGVFIMRTIASVLFESKLRNDNFIDALKLGLFGSDADTKLKNVALFNQSKKVLIDAECNTIQSIIQGKNND